MNRYREECGSVYEYVEDQHAYIFIGKLNGETLEEFIATIEEL